MKKAKETLILVLLSSLFASCSPSGKHQEVEAPPADQPTAGQSAGDYVLFSDVKPVFEKNCMSCHFNSVSAPKVNWLDYETAKSYAQGSKLPSYLSGGRMPPSSSSEAAAFSDGEKELLLAWINSGALQTAPSPSDSASPQPSEPDPNAPPTVVVDDEIRNFQLTQTCKGCHGEYGISFGGMPHLAGLSEDYILEQLKAFAGTYEEVTPREDSPTMKDMVAGLTEENFEFLAKYFGSLKFDPGKLDLPPISDDQEAYDRGQKLAEENSCLGCHNNADLPRIAGQDAYYIENSLYAFSEGTRTGRSMPAIAKSINSDDYYALSFYLTQQAHQGQTSLKDITSDNVSYVYKSQCASCHNGPTADPRAPKLEGTPGPLVADQLRKFSRGDRKDLVFSYMDNLGLETKQISHLTRYIMGQDKTKKCSAEAPSNISEIFSTEELAQAEELTQKCTSCHRTGPAVSFPKIHGQREAYIKNSLTAFRDGTRDSFIMKKQVGGLSDEDIQIIAKYLSSFTNSCEQNN